MGYTMTNWIGIPEDISKYIGFVYIIENKLNGMYYIGQKKFWKKVKISPLKGKKRVRRKLIESYWKSYYGSSMELQNDVEKYGKDNFTRKILYLCKSKAEMNYLETKEQFDRGVLYDIKSYNKIINCRINSNMLVK